MGSRISVFKDHNGAPDAPGEENPVSVLYKVERSLVPPRSPVAHKAIYLVKTDPRISQGPFPMPQDQIPAPHHPTEVGLEALGSINGGDPVKVRTLASHPEFHVLGGLH